MLTRVLRQLGQADREVQLGVGIVGDPALAAGFGARAGVDARQKLKPLPNVSALGSAAGAARPPKPPWKPPNCAAAILTRGHAGLELTSRRPRADAAVSPWVTSPASGSTARRASELLWDLVGAGQRAGVLVGVHLAAQAELEPLQAFGDERLQTRQLRTF